MDGLGWRARFGILVIHNDPVPETELWAMAPPGVTFHTARFESPRKPGADYAGDAAAALEGSPDVARGLQQLGSMPLDAICVCWTSGSFFGGTSFDDSFSRQATVAAGGIPVLLAATAMTGAMAALGVTRPMVVMPPWFPPAVVEAAVDYLRASGVDPLGPARFDLGEGWRHMPTYETYDRGAHWTVRPEDLYRQVRQSFPGEADGVLIPGSAMRTLAAIESLEHDLGVPVITANQASLWSCLRAARTRVSVPGFGQLLRAL
ncbi:maleate cis-trans isomerase family protein [Allorhizocola rhizosphaerae]|uniref:maleate cis-trans isomerase family protein n=1 Tax=Allorhizocola rhizosphaerae TaxID=1872709 RepID=UPI000E3CEDCB|nr:hypothetical protein [Allorhizocola rhizosphaerae]